MDIVVELDSDQDTSLLVGHWDDLQFLVEKLSEAWEGSEYRLERVPGSKDTFLFIEDVLADDSYECGIVEKRGKRAYAFSDAVHDMIMGAYQRYVEEFGAIAAD